MAAHLLKYPRTPHLEGSRLQPGDSDLAQTRFRDLAGRHLIIEEKVDGANCGISFDADGALLLQSRGHYLTGGPRERHFAELKAWAGSHAVALWDAIGDRYVVYGEWMAAKHTVFYDALPHLFLEFDVYDRGEGVFLSTPARRALLAAVPILGVPVLLEGSPKKLGEVTALVRPSLYKTQAWREVLADAASAAGQDPALVVAQTDGSDESEGVYVKVEEDGVCVGRHKWVRASFLNTICDPVDGQPSTHWLDRPHLANLCSPGVDLYATKMTEAMTALRPGQVR